MSIEDVNNNSLHQLANNKTQEIQTEIPGIYMPKLAQKINNSSLASNSSKTSDVNNNSLSRLENSNDTQTENRTVYRRMGIVHYCNDGKAPCGCDVIPRMVENQNKNRKYKVKEYVCNKDKTHVSILPDGFSCVQLFARQRIESQGISIDVKAGCELRCIADC